MNTIFFDVLMQSLAHSVTICSHFASTTYQTAPKSTSLESGTPGEGKRVGW